MLEDTNKINNGSTIAKNTGYFTLALAFQKVLSFVYFTYIARAIGSDKIGSYIVALAYATLFGIFIDLGLSTGLIREIAKAKDKAKSYLNTVLAVKVVLALIIYLAVLSSVKALEFFGLTPPPLNLMLWAGAIMVLDSFTLTFYAVFRGKQRLSYESLGTVINKVIVLVLGFLAVRFSPSVTTLLSVILIGSGFNVIYVFLLLAVKEKIFPFPRWDRAAFKYIFKISLPFAIAGIFVAIYANLDSILLKLLTADKYAGWYAVAYKLTYSFQFIPLAFVASLFPAYAEYYLKAKDKLVNVFERAMFYLLLIVVPISVGTIILADKIVIGLYTQAFAASVLPLQILISGLILVFLNFPIGYLLNACDRQVIQTVNIGVTVAVNVILNIILIPKYNFIGAAGSAVISALVQFLLGIFWARKVIKFRIKFLLIKTLIIFLSAAGMGAIVYLIKDKLQTYFHWHYGTPIYLVLVFALGILLYFSFIILLGGMRRNDFQYFINLVKKKISPVKIPETIEKSG